ncbi:MAG: M28 family peptidase [Firmicutes bacterium]|nr:M28 family peptidase [Bacillota bacterium]
MAKALSLLVLTTALLAEPPLDVRFRQELAFLAGPERQGRGNGSKELEQCASFLVKHYDALGLKNVTQRMPYVSRVTRAKGEATLGGKSLVWGQDVEAMGFSSDASFASKPVVFVGYGTQGAALDELAGLDLKDKVALMGRTLPAGGPFAALGRGERSVVTRAQRLRNLGVAAVIVLESEAKPRPLIREDGPLNLEVPVLSLPLKTLEGLNTGVEAGLRRLQDSGQVASAEVACRFSLNLALERHSTPLPSVVAVIPGTDPKLKEEYILLGAHFDHLGLGERSSMAGEAGRGLVHPGADDNASGTVMVMELARMLKRQPLRRSVALLHVSGEEIGLLGSAHWIQNPTIPLPQVKFMVNFDMVGRLDPAKPTLQLGGLGAPKSALVRAKSLAPQGLAVGEDLGMAVGGSDHMSFAAAKIPTFFFFTGIHTDYHRPSDTPDKINLQGMVTVAAMAEKIVQDLANADQVPAFDPETAKLPTMRGGPVRVAFGALPDFADHPKGFRINGASPGSAAEAIGMKAGDVMISFGGKPIRNLYDFQEALSSFKPGDTVKVVWLRDDQRFEKEAVLKGR